MKYCFSSFYGLFLLGITVFMFLRFVQVDRNKYHFFKDFEDKENDPVSITHVHHTELQRYLLLFNDCLSENFFEKLWRLHITPFRFSVKNMLARFKELCIELNDNGVQYDENTKQLDFWRCLETIQGTEFATFVSRKREEYCKKPATTHPSVNSLMGTFINK